MAGNKGAIIGIGIIGISALAWMSMKQPSATTNGELGGGGSYVDDSDSSSGDNDWDSPDCSLAWDSSGNRISNTWVNHGELSVNWNSRGRNCDLQGFAIKVYTDKRVYIAGESIKVLILKKYFSTEWKNNWHKWKNEDKANREQMAFLMGIESTEGNSLWNFQKTTGSSKSQSSIESMQWDGDLKADGWPWQSEEWKNWKRKKQYRNNCGVVMKTLSTANSDVGEYYLRFMGELGPYQNFSACGASDCNHTSKSEACNNRKTTSQKLITILPRDCSSPSSAESYESESKVDLRAEHFIQSYVNNWM